ncbi:60S ribosomal protein L10, partial [Galemys pyrenaicus]
MPRSTVGHQKSPRHGAKQKESIQTNFGKSQGMLAKVCIGQLIISISIEQLNNEHGQFLTDCWKVHISKKWVFTQFNMDKFEDIVIE